MCMTQRHGGNGRVLEEWNEYGGDITQVYTWNKEITETKTSITVGF